MSKPETPKRCGVCGSELRLNRVFARPDSWVCVKAGCPAWRWDGEGKAIRAARAARERKK